MTANKIKTPIAKQKRLEMLRIYKKAGNLVGPTTTAVNVSFWRYNGNRGQKVLG